VSSAPRWRNLTDHQVTIISDGQRAVLPPDGVVARVEVTHPIIGYTAVNNVVVPVMMVKQTSLVGLPAYRPDTNLVVSQFVARAAGGRPDVYCPGPLIRKDGGEIEGTRGLIMSAAFAPNAVAVGQ
jgi:hypothetical protein